MSSGSAPATERPSPATTDPRPVDGPPERTQPWCLRLARMPYFYASLLALAYVCLAAYRQPWRNDFGVHAGTVEQLRQNLINPGDPMVAADGDNAYFTPYTVVLGALARLAGWSGYTTLTVVAPISIAVLLFGLYKFVRVFSDRSWTPVVALILLPLLWGQYASAWSGFINLQGLPQILPYPSTFAFGLMLLWWAYLVAALDRPRPVRWLLLGLLFGVLFLIHSFTAVEATLGAVAIGFSRLRLWRPRLILLAVAAAVLVIFTWPYYSVIEVMTAAGDFNGLHRQLYAEIPTVYGPPLALCVPALVIRLRRDRRDPLSWMFLLAFAVVMAGWATDNFAVGRLWPAVMVTAQVALAVELTTAVSGLLSRPEESHGRRARLRDALIGGWAVLAVLACGWGYSQQNDDFNKVLRVDRPMVAFPDRSAWITEKVRPGEVMVANMRNGVPQTISRDLIGHGILFVAPTWPDPTLPDEQERRVAVDQLIAPQTPPLRRREILDRYDVSWIMDTQGTWTWADTFAVEVVPGPGKARLIRVS